MTASVSMRVRIVALAGLLGLLTLGAATVFLSGGKDAAEAAPLPARRTAALPAPQAAPKERRAATPRAAARVAPRKPDSTLPPTIARALELHGVVVVSVVSSGAPLDTLALDEARAGAKRAGVGFVRVDVADQRSMKRLTAELGVRHTPSVLVFTHPDRLFVQVRGFADRETVAQAAANASP